MTIGIRSNLVVSFTKKKGQFVLIQFFRYLCFTGISGNLAETPILKDIFIFLANGHSFQKCSFLVEILSFLKEVFSVFEKCQILMAWMSIYIKKLSNLIKTSIFLRKCLFVHVLIFIRVFLLLENCYFDSKYDFIRWYFGKSVIFLVKFTFQVA